MKNPAPARTGEHAPERGARGDGNPRWGSGPGTGPARGCRSAGRSRRAGWWSPSAEGDHVRPVCGLAQCRWSCWPGKMKSASSTMSWFSLNSFCQPPLTWCFWAIELRVSPLTTLYSPSPFSTFLPVGVVTVFLAAGRSCEREAGCSDVRSCELPADEEPEEVDGAAGWSCHRCRRRSTGRCRRSARHPCPARRGPSRRRLSAATSRPGRRWRRTRCRRTRPRWRTRTAGRRSTRCRC